MITRWSLFNQAALLTLLFACCCDAVHAQGFIRKDQNLPDASRFYMARQQWQVINDNPTINGQPGGPPGAAQGAAPGSAGPAPPPLPRAGFQSYSPNTPQLSTSLPKTNNGVPPKLPPARAPKSGPSGARGHAGKLLAAPKPVSAPTQPAVQAYAPYKGYNPVPAPMASGAQSMNSQSNVKGSVLHWARARHQAGGY